MEDLVNLFWILRNNWLNYRSQALNKNCILWLQDPRFRPLRGLRGDDRENQGLTVIFMQ